MKPVQPPLISIVTPAYNCAKFIQHTIRSVQRQTYERWEMIIVDDGSNDETAAICQGFAKVDCRIAVVSLPHNSGAAKARNMAIAKAKGAYLAFVDGDDIWLPQKLEKQLLFMQSHDIAFSFTSYSFINENGAAMGAVVQAPSCVDYRMLAGNTIIGCLTVMLDCRRIGCIRMPAMESEDIALWLQLLRNGCKAYGLPEELAQYRIVKGSVSRNKLKKAIRYWNLLRKQEGFGTVTAGNYFLKYAWNAYRKNGLIHKG